jgi:uncharacterized protein (DUF427 family)
MAGTADHPISITPYAGAVVIHREGRQVARTTRALSLKEASYPAVLYVPRADADMALLTPSDRTTHCPYKGDARYFDLPGAPNAVWSYETPFDDVSEIAGHLAFYPDMVEIEA